MDFGADLDGVRALLPTRLITPTSLPNEDQVIGFIAQISSWVGGVIGDIDRFSDGEENVIRDMGLGLVYLGAASWTDNAGHPEFSQPGDTSYGQILWERFLQGIEGLREYIEYVEDTSSSLVYRGIGISAPMTLVPDYLQF